MNNDTHNQHLLRPPTLLASNNAISNQNHMSSPQPTAPPECGNCGFRDRWILHHVRLRGLTRRLCTSCVLRLHPSSFCPSCFQFYDPSSSPHPLPSNRLICCKCSSITHSNCVSTSSSSDAPPHSTSSSSPTYLCPPCAKPNFSFFDLDAKPTSSSDPKDCSKIDRKAALVMVCAARIASASMTKAVIVARADAERKVREAAYARKRAREALEHVALVVAREKARRKEGSSEVSGSAIKEEKTRNMDSNKGSATTNMSALALPNTKLGSGGLQRREISNGVGGLDSLTKKELLVAVEEGVRHIKAEAGECVKGNGTAATEEAPASLGRKESENGEANHVQNSHIVGGNVSSK